LLSILSHKISTRIQDCIQEEGKEGAPHVFAWNKPEPNSITRRGCTRRGWWQSGEKGGFLQFSYNFCNEQSQSCARACNVFRTLLMAIKIRCQKRDDLSFIMVKKIIYDMCQICSYYWDKTFILREISKTKYFRQHNCLNNWNMVLLLKISFKYYFKK